jgi:hypothetical protein
MSDESNTAVHWSFWLIGALCLVWNLLGVMTYGLVVAESRMSYGPSEITMAIIIPLVALFLVWYSKYATSNKWIS